MNRPTVYLGGTITNDPATWDWRNTARYFFSPFGIDVLDPCRNKRRGEVDMYGFPLKNYKFPIPYIVRDKVNVMENSDALLCNLSMLPPDRPPCGSLMELGMAVATNVPIILCTTIPGILRHPFTQQFCAGVYLALDDAMQAMVCLIGQNENAHGVAWPDPVDMAKLR